MTIVRRQEQRRIPLWLVPLGALLCVGCGGVAWQLGIVSDVWTSSQGPETERAAAKAVAASSAKAVGAAADRSSLTDAIKQRCQGTLGTWCTDFWTQAEVPAVTAPRGNHTCSMDCNKASREISPEPVAIRSPCHAADATLELSLRLPRCPDPSCRSARAAPSPAAAPAQPGGEASTACNP
jgi:hypothetical protein